ncbi:MAG: 7-cyano-7-deazaguanine synthase QueC [Planctomycetia bacterium]|nr:7-cyano-7-deazaguanine synthase QueC [Planctomycetia bacterium]
MKNAVVLLSGGLDSSTTAAIARSEGFRLYALTVDYGQRHVFELEAAKKIAVKMDVVRHEIFCVPLSQFGGSALTSAEMEVPEYEKDFLPGKSKIPVTYVPARNTVMLSLALAFSETVNAEDIFIGVNAVDYSGYPDCRPEFITAFETLANLATKSGVEGTSRFRIHTPLMRMTKSEIIQKGLSLGVDYSLTHTCYRPAEDGKSCGVCEACVLRLRGFHEAGCTDPISYFLGGGNLS